MHFISDLLGYWCTVECICGRSNPRHSANTRRLSNNRGFSIKKTYIVSCESYSKIRLRDICERFVADDFDGISLTSHCTNWLLLKVVVQGQIDMLSFNDTVDTSTAGWTTVSKCKCSGRSSYIVLQRREALLRFYVLP